MNAFINQQNGSELTINRGYYHRGFRKNNLENISVAQGQLAIGNEKQQLTTSGLATCAPLIIDGAKTCDGRDKNMLGHIDATMSPREIAYFIRQNFTEQELKAAKIFYSAGSGDFSTSETLNNYAVDNIETAFELLGLTTENITYIGKPNSFRTTVGINNQGTFYEDNSPTQLNNRPFRYQN